MDAPPPTFAEQVLARFVQKNPLAAGLRLILEQLFVPAQIDALFEANRDRQYTRQVLFSTLVEVMAAVVTRRVGSVHAALKKRKASLEASFTAFYNKLNGAEPALAEALVHHVAGKAHALVTQMGGLREDLLPGWRVRIADGNHWAATERRLQVLWEVVAGPRPGFALVAFDPAAMLVTDTVLCEDAHAQERSLTDRLLAWVRAGDCWLADRNFCTLPILYGLLARAANFVIRQHGNLGGHLVGKRRACGKIEGGAVFEQAIEVRHEGVMQVLRRITIELETPTRDGDREVHVLSALPSTVDAVRIAKLYSARWTLEGAFADLARWFDAELAPLGYPRAAALGFGVALAAYNVVSTLLGALRAEHGEAVVEHLSGYYVAEFGRDAVGVIDDLVEPSGWERWQVLSLAAAALLLRQVAVQIDLSVLGKAKRAEKKPVPKRTRFKNKPHVSTKRLLDRTVREKP